MSKILISNLFPGSSGDILYHNGESWVRLSKGTSSQVLTIDSEGFPSWGGGSSYITSVDNTDTIDLNVLDGKLTADFASLNISQFTNDSLYVTNSDLTDYVENTRTITINGTSYNLSANRTWTVGDVLTSSSYSNPSWITNLAYSKLTGAPTNISSFTNDSGYITSSALSPYLTSSSAALTYQPIGTYATASNTMAFTNKSGNISQWTNDSAYITSTGAKTAIGHYVVGKTFTGTTVSSSVAETLVMSLLTSANTFQQYDIPEIYFSGKKGGAFTANATLRLYINTSNTISGATLIETLTLSSTTRTSNIQRINGCFTTSTNYNVMSATTSSASDSTTIAANESSITWDTTQAYYVIASIQLGSTGDTFTPTYLLIKNNR